MNKFIRDLLSENSAVSSQRLGYLSCIFATIVLAGCMVWMAFAKVDISYIKEISIVALAILGMASGTKVWQKIVEVKSADSDKDTNSVSLPS